MDTTGAGMSPRLRNKLLLAAYLIRVYLSLNSLGFTVSLPTIMERFDALDMYPIMVVLSSSSMAVLALTGGRLIDRLGIKTMTLLAVGGVALSAICAGFAPSLPVFIACYMLMAMCHGMGISMPVAIICETTNTRERSRYMGYYSAANNLGLFLGPMLGGLIIDHFSPRIIPLYTLAMPLIVLWIVARHYPRKTRRPAGGRFDLPGALLSSAAIAALVIVLNMGGRYIPWRSPLIAGGLAAVALLIAAFILVEKHSARPFLDLKLFRIPSFAVGVALVFLGMPSISLCASYVTLFVQKGLGGSAAFSGTFALPKTFFVLLITAVFNRHIAERPRLHRVLMPLGGVLIAATALLLHFATQGSRTMTIVALYCAASLFGIGEGLCYMLAHPYCQKDLPQASLGAGVSVQTLCTTLGSCMASTTFGAILSFHGGSINAAFPQMALVVCIAGSLYALISCRAKS